MIVMKSSGDFPWPWAESEDQAEAVFRSTYPSLHAHFNGYRDSLMKRQDQGRFWWELRPCAFWDEFRKPKIWFQQIQFHPRYAIERQDLYGNNKTTFLPTDDLYLLCVLNSPLVWWHNFRFLPHMKDEALATVVYKMDEIPIAQPEDQVRSQAETKGKRIVEIIDSQQRSRREILDWLHVELGIEKPNQKLADPLSLDADNFVAEVKKSRGRSRPLTAAGLRSLREEHARSIESLQPLGAELASLERQISDLVNAAYGLTPEEVALMWRTAPPRMPIARAQ
jgi:hypothetical protein